MQPMTPKERSEHYARRFPKYPRLRYDDRWLDGFWVTGQNYRGSGFHGAYPPGYLERMRAIFPREFEGRVLHLFSGSLDKSVGGVRVDISLARDPPPDVYGDAHNLPFPDGTFDLVVADTPYTDADAKIYGTKMVFRKAVLAEIARVTKPGGHLIWLDTRAPMFRKREWHWWGIIGIARSTNHLYRAATFYQRREDHMAKMKVKIEEAARLIAAGLAVLFGEDAATVHEAVTEQKKNTKIREQGDDGDDAPAPKRRGPKPPVEDDDEDEAPAKRGKKPVAAADDDDDDDDADEDESEKPKIPKDAAFADLDRAGLKKLALAYGLDVAGKSREDLTELLKALRDGDKGKGAKPATKPAADDDDDDDEDEAPVKKGKKKPVAADDDDDEDAAPKKKGKKVEEPEEAGKPDEDDYPTLKAMKADLEVFYKIHKDALTAAGFFGGKPKKGTPKAEVTYDEVMEDKDMIKEAWADNVWPEIVAKNWDKMKAEAADDEDDE